MRRPFLVADDDRLRDTVVHTAAVGMAEVLDEAEASFQHGGAVSQGALHRLPERDALVDERDDADPDEALS